MYSALRPCDPSRMHEMTADEARAFLLDGTRTGKLATVRRDGRPHVVPIWFLLDGDDVVFTTGRDTVKGRNLLRDGRASLCVDDERPPFGYVVVSGQATATAGASDLLVWATRIAERYMGAELADEYGSRNAVESELLVRLKAERLHGLARVAD